MEGESLSTDVLSAAVAATLADHSEDIPIQYPRPSGRFSIRNCHTDEVCVAALDHPIGYRATYSHYIMGWYNHLADKEHAF